MSNRDMKWLRQRHQWRIRNGEIPLGTRTLITGILDLSRFLSDDGKPDRQAVLRAAERMERDGARLIDVTAQRDPIEGKILSPDEELPRLVPVLRRLRNNLGIPVCVTTCHADTAERVLELDAAVIHDFSGLSVDPRLPTVVNRGSAGLVIGHVRGTPGGREKLVPVANLVEMVARDLQSAIARSRAAGIDPRQVVVDPGLNMGKRGPENFLILRALPLFGELGQPVQVSPSQKPFLVESIKAPESERMFATAAMASLAAAQGVQILRVHEVAEIAQVLKAVDRVLEVD